eukprot:3383864-Prymnesium_polylepis.1
MATHRAEHVVALLAAGTALWDIYGDSSGGDDEHTRTAHLAVARLVAAVVEKVKAANAPAPANETKGRPRRPSRRTWSRSPRRTAPSRTR